MHHGDPIRLAEFGFEFFGEGFGSTGVFGDGEGGGTAAGHERHGCAIGAEEFLE